MSAFLLLRQRSWPWVLLALAAAVQSTAQPAGAGSDFTRSLTFEAGFAGSGDLADQSGRAFSDIDVRHAGVALGQRAAIQGATSLSLEIRYDRYELQVDSATVPLPDEVQAIALQASLRRPVNERWTLLASVEPSFANSDSLFDQDGVGVNVGLLGLYRQSDTLTWAFGLLYRTPADDLEVVPAVGFDWRPTDSWTIAVGFPRSSVTYAASERTRIAFAALAHGGTFHVSEPVGRTLSSIPPLHDSLLDYTEVRVGLGLDYRPHPALELSAMVGAIVHQEFDYYERDYRLKAEDPTAFVTLGARLLF